MKLAILTINSVLLPLQTKANRIKVVLDWETTGPNSACIVLPALFTIKLETLELCVSWYGYFPPSSKVVPHHGRIREKASF